MIFARSQQKFVYILNHTRGKCYKYNAENATEVMSNAHSYVLYFHKILLQVRVNFEIGMEEDKSKIGNTQDRVILRNGRPLASTTRAHALMDYALRQQVLS